jgi:glutathione synthase/RimK-type ligase-like ATP-grasp enzyme
VLLIITNKDDLTADFLIIRIIELGKPYFRLNSEDITDAEYSFYVHRGTSIRRIIVSGKEVDLNAVSSVWYRRKLWANPPEVVVPDQRRFVAGETINLIEGLVANPTILWVNPMDSVALAERKIYQLRIAQQIGFTIPQTIVSNNPDELRRFYNENQGRVICKPIFHGLFITKNERHAVYTHRIEEGDLSDDLQLRSCPTMLQKEVPKGTDIRVTFIGKSVFSAEIYSQTAHPLDWRRMNGALSYRSYDLSKEIKDRCINMLRILNISFGAFDFVLTDAGQLYFLEVNATGEWAWLEKEMGFPMRDAFIKLFGI